MEIDLASFLSPAGSLLGEVTQRVLEFLSVQDLIEYVASSASSENGNDVTGAAHDSAAAEEEGDSPANPRRQRQQRSPSAAGRGGSWVRTGVGGRESGQTIGGRSSCRTNCGESGRGGSSPEGELPHRREKRSTTGAGDEAGGGSRPPTPYRGSDAQARPGDRPEEDEEWGDASAINGGCSTASGDHDGYRGAADGGGSYGAWFDPTAEEREDSSRAHRQSGRRGSGVQVATLRSHAEGEPSSQSKPSGKCVGLKKESEGVLGILVGLGLHPWAALGALRGGVAHLLGGVPLLALLRWASGGASMVLGVSFRVALLPYDVTKGVVGYVVGSLEAMLNIATEIWNELRHLSLSELAVVISCVVSGNALPDFLLHPLDYSGVDSGSSCGGTGGVGGGRGGTGRNSRRILSRSSRGTTSLESEGASGFLSERLRGPSSSNSDADPGAATAGSRGAWQRAHSMRRRLDRVNRTASLVSYEERAESAVPRAKAERVRRRMHYAMSLQCFQATVTVNNGDPSSVGGSDEGDVSPSDGRVSAGGGAFMCTPQSFPPTPVSRAHVMARTSQFSDDILFLARDQLRLGENLKPGVDETTRATADFLRRQQRLAVLDGNNACEGIVLTCGHHRATKIGPALYSSARAMVPVLRNRHVYFQVSCVREGPLAPSIGVGLSTPEMPLSTLVGAFSNSVGLCSTGQVLMSSRWYGAPGEFAMRKACMSTVGVLVYLDGSRPFRSWDGDMVRALVCFSVDGRLVRVATGPVPQAAAPSTTVYGAGGSFPPPQQPVAYGPLPPPPTPSPMTVATLDPQPLVVEDDTLTAPSPAGTIGQGSGEAGELFSPPPSPWSPIIEEEMAPWESAAAEATSARILGGGAAAFGRVGAAGPGNRPPARAAGGVAVMAPGVAPPPMVPEISAALGLALPKDRDLFPTVTIHSSNTEILCRFCAEDLLPVTRDSIGAPPGAPVYALDGSLIHLP